MPTFEIGFLLDFWPIACREKRGNVDPTATFSIPRAHSLLSVHIVLKSTTPGPRPAPGSSSAPLPERMRPRTLQDLVGHGREVKRLTTLIGSGHFHALILWGPPGCGKTTMARAIAQELQTEFIEFSAVLQGVPELRKVLKRAEEQMHSLHPVPPLLFIDEVHRFNKAQQDALLSHVERGWVRFIGATTENPSFSVNNALLSRAELFQLSPLSHGQLHTVVERALADAEQGLGELQLTLGQGTADLLVAQADGDARRLLHQLDTLAQYARAQGAQELTPELAQQALGEQALRHDRSGDDHYNVVSAFIKSLRGSDPDAALYWMMRMIEAGEDPRFVVRRMMIFASEDIGNADPRALQIAVATSDAHERLGMPESAYALVQCCTYLAGVPKSNAAATALQGVRTAVRRFGSLEVPKRFRNAPTSTMKDLGYGKNYRYPHNEQGGFAPGEHYFPDGMEPEPYYRPSSRGFEGKIAERLAKLWATRYTPPG